MAHHSETVPWQLLGQRIGATLRWFRLSNDAPARHAGRQHGHRGVAPMAGGCAPARGRSSSTRMAHRAGSGWWTAPGPRFGLREVLVRVAAGLASLHEGVAEPRRHRRAGRGTPTVRLDDPDSRHGECTSTRHRPCRNRNLRGRLSGVPWIRLAGLTKRRSDAILTYVSAVVPAMRRGKASWSLSSGCSGT